MPDTAILVKNLVNTGIFSLLGIVILAISFVVVDKLTPGDLWGEINDKQNVAVGIFMAGVCIGISIIVAASLHG